jgi:putative transposase
MFTVRRLGLGGSLAATLTTTNCIESMISIAKRTTGRVTKWKDGSMKKRWVAAGMLEAERSFRRVRGYKGMPKLLDALHRELASKVTPALDTTEEYDQAAA